MAIYTQYGRYLKAKMFKEMLESSGDAFMLFGLGNPQWDNGNADPKQNITVAPYNTSTLYPDTDNQFHDPNVCQYFQKPTLNDGDISGLEVQESIIDSVPCDSNGVTVNSDNDHILGTSGTTNIGNYVGKCKNVLPVFPSVWHYGCQTDNNTPEDTSDDFNADCHRGEIIFDGVTRVTQSNYNEYYIIKDSSGYRLCHKDSSSTAGTSIEVPSDTIQKQYFSEMYIRGRALQKGLYAPVGLLGAVKCSVSFVKDIEDDEYNGSIDQFWYGDRYWQIVRPDENDPITDSASIDDMSTLKERFPYHLIITSTVNPRVLCDELSIDNSLVPRQIAIYTRLTPQETENDLYYRAYENVFNFGQYPEITVDDTKKLKYTDNGLPYNEDNVWPNEWHRYDSESSQYDYTVQAGPVISDVSAPIPVNGKILNFTLPTESGDVESESSSDTYATPNGEFKFILHDYIRGQVRDAHSVDRFGYVISF